MTSSNVKNFCPQPKDICLIVIEDSGNQKVFTFEKPKSENEMKMNEKYWKKKIWTFFPQNVIVAAMSVNSMQILSCIVLLVCMQSV